MRDVIDPALDMKGLSTAAAGGGGDGEGGYEERVTTEPECGQCSSSVPAMS